MAQYPPSARRDRGPHASEVAAEEQLPFLLAGQRHRRAVRGEWDAGDARGERIGWQTGRAGGGCAGRLDYPAVASSGNGLRRSDARIVPEGGDPGEGLSLPVRAVYLYVLMVC